MNWLEKHILKMKSTEVQTLGTVALAPVDGHTDTRDKSSGAWVKYTEP